MNQRFITLTFAACTVMFAAIWAISAPTSQIAPAPAADTSAAVTYADCDAVRAANAAPLRAGQPGYRAALDANMNGLACESTNSADAPMTVAAPATDEPVSEPQPLPDLPPPPQIDLPPPDPAAANPPNLQ